MNYKEKNLNEIASNTIIPTGIYDVTIKDAKEKTSLDGMSEYVSITAVTADGTHIFVKHMTECDSEKAVNIGLQRLKELAEAIGENSFKNFPSILIGKKVRAKVAVTSDVSFGKQNRIDRYFPIAESTKDNSSIVSTCPPDDGEGDIPF